MSRYAMRFSTQCFELQTSSVPPLHGNRVHRIPGLQNWLGRSISQRYFGEARSVLGNLTDVEAPEVDWDADRLCQFVDN